MKTDDNYEKGPAVLSPSDDDPNDFYCEHLEFICYIEVHPRKGDDTEDVIITTQGTPTVFKDVKGVEVDENGNGRIIK